MNMRVYYSEAPDIGDIPDNRGALIWDESTLKEEMRGAAVGWSGNANMPKILLDMGQECALGGITVRIVTAGLGVPEWQSAEVAVSARSENCSVYTMLGRLVPKAGTAALDINLPEQSAFRYLRFDLRRKSFGERNYCIPLPFIRLDMKSDAVSAPLMDEAEARREFEDEPVCCDRYGQAIFLDRVGKIKSDDMLRRDAEVEGVVLNSVRRDSARYDKYGGWMGLGKRFEAAGFFRTKKVDGVWWLVTPEGNPYIMKGVDLVTYLEGAYYSPLHVKGTSRVRTAFGELPDPGLYGECYKEFGGVKAVNYLYANLMIKYGVEFEARWANAMHQRLIGWGFNCASKWEKHPLIRVPYVHYLMRICDPIKIGWMIDAFDPLFEEKMTAAHGDTLRELKDDPYLIGYHFTNEDGWDDSIFGLMLASGETLPAKCNFVEWISGLAGGNQREMNRLLGVEADSPEVLRRMAIPFEGLSRDIVSGFIRFASDVFFRKTRHVIKSIDPNHLYMGGTLTPGWHSSFDWDVGGAAHLDVLSFDHYADDGGRWMEPYLGLDIPIVNVEYGFTATDQGHSQAFERTGCATQQERGERWQGYVESMFRYPQFVGAGHFILYDQAITRGMYGEGYAYGLLNTQDQPYEEFLEYVKRTHGHLEELHQKGWETDIC